MFSWADSTHALISAHSLSQCTHKGKLANMYTLLALFVVSLLNEQASFLVFSRAEGLRKYQVQVQELTTPRIWSLPQTVMIYLWRCEI